jgi:hypothetical protein
MDMLSRSDIAKLFHRSLAARAGALLLTVVGLTIFTLPAAWLSSGIPGLAAVAASAGVCLVAALASLAIAHLLRGPAVTLQALLLSMLVRMGIPLAFAVMAYLRAAPLVNAGLMYYLVIFYLPVLAVETVLSCPPTAAANGASDAPGHCAR